MNRYDLLIDSRPGWLGRKHWLGNLRWFAEEMGDCFAFRTSPVDASETEEGKACRTLFGLGVPGAAERCDYRADGLEATLSGGQRFALWLPLERFGALIEWDALPLRVFPAAEAGRKADVEKPFSSETAPGRILWRDGAYTVVFRFGDARITAQGAGFELRPGDLSGKARLAIAFHVDAVMALAEAEALFARPEEVRKESREAWGSYLASCPVVEVTQNFTWQAPEGPVTHTKEEILRRQYWHWHCLLANVFDLPFNRLPAYVAPDKTNWFGVWSNDGPECLRALAHTNRHALARACLLGYVRTALTKEDDLSWYLHGTGEGCLGRPGDVGRLSHGVPTIVTAVAEYVRVTGDCAILDEPGGYGRTVWERLSRYMRAVYERRDLDGDGLVEWNNLWEGGADDKVGPFFSHAGLHEWIDAVKRLGDAELAEFYRLNGRPVVNLYEQSFFLDALAAFRELAEKRGDAATAREAASRYAHTCRVLEERHWDERDGIYRDWDVRAQNQVASKNQDAFYLPRFLRNEERSRRLFEHLLNPAEFRLRFTPTLARSEAGFDPKGYWCGGYWPRESNYIARALHAAGLQEEAVELLIKALCAGTGKKIPENINPLTGEDNTGITGMAYNILVVLALCEVAAERTDLPNRPHDP